MKYILLKGIRWKATSFAVKAIGLAALSFVQGAAYVIGRSVGDRVTSRFPDSAGNSKEKSDEKKQDSGEI